MEFKEPVDRSHVTLGVIVMALGLLFLMDKLEIVQRALLGLFWPGVLVAWGFMRIVWPSRPGREVGGVWIALVGGLLMLDQLSIVRMGESWPLFVIIGGMLMIFRALDWLPSRSDRDFFAPNASKDSALATGTKR
jgi:cell wall-active antibiotic response 4TMS protein YvqF